MRGRRRGVAGAAALALASVGRVAGDAAAEDLFVEVAAEAGLDFAHFNGMSGEFYYHEMMGAGAALFDYDGDGDLDAYLVQGHMLGGKHPSTATLPQRHPERPGDRLFRNDLALPRGERRLRFLDVTEASGIREGGYGMGVAVGDYDNDGDPDLYVTNFGPNRMLRNEGDGTFSDATAPTGTGEERWSVSASFVDYDLDGWLDLYVANYVAFRLEIHKPCRSLTGAIDYCGPLSYPAEPDRLFRNRGDGTFEDVSVRAGIAGERGGALGVVAADFDGDGWPDLYVANDLTPNLLWINQGNGTFRNEALLAGAAVNWEGQAEASMGTAAGDFDADGDEDVFLTHLTGQKNTLYVNDGSGVFRDESMATGLGAPSWDATGFGTEWIDYDNDGWPDLLAVNGAVRTLERLVRAGDPFPLHQTNQLFRNLGDGRFAEVTAAAGTAFTLSEVSRGAAFGDVDNDGDTDVLVTQNSGPARLLENRRGAAGRWLGARLLAKPGGRDLLGGRAEVRRPGAPRLVRRVHTDGSYASAGDPRILAGLGTGGVAGLEVSLPGGRVLRFERPPERTYLTVAASGGDPR